MERVDTDMGTLDLTPATSTLARLVADLDDSDLPRRTPCPDYTVGDLADHIGGLTIAFTEAAHKSARPGDHEPSGDASRLEAGWRERIATDLAHLAEAWSDPAAYEGMTQAGPIELPAQIAAVVALNEVVTHGWDLARAVDADYSVDEEALAVCLDFAAQFSDDDRGETWGPVVDVPADAPALDRLVGLLGRDPAWRS